MPKQIASSKNEIADKFIEMINSTYSVEIDGYFIHPFEETTIGTSGDPDENVLEFYLNGVGDVFVTNAELDIITYDDKQAAFDVGGYRFKFFSVKPVAL